MATDRSSSADAVNPTISETVGRFVATLRLEDIPPAVVERSKLCLLDFLGVTLAGAGQAPARVIGDFVRTLGGVPEASVWGFAFRAPVAFALAERRRAAGRDLLAAVIAGYEVLIRTGRAMAASAMHDRGYHGPGLFGAFGAAAAAATACV